MQKIESEMSNEETKAVGLAIYVEGDGVYDSFISTSSEAVGAFSGSSPIKASVALFNTASLFRMMRTDVGKMS